MFPELQIFSTESVTALLNIFLVSLVLDIKRLTPVASSFRGIPFYTSIQNSSRVERASLTVEASLILPIYVFFIALLFSLFSVIFTELEVEKALTEAGKTLALQGYVEEEMKETLQIENFPEEWKPLLFLGEVNLLVREKVENEGIYERIFGGRAGILCKAEEENERIHLTAHYEIMLPIVFFGKERISVVQEVKARKWTGYTFTRVLSDEEIVYVTPEGEVYHRNRCCDYLQVSLTEVRKDEIPFLRSKDRSKYYPCEYCHPETAGPVHYYIASYGTRYHCTVLCPALKRTILEVPFSQRGDRRPCPKCGGGV